MSRSALAEILARKTLLIFDLDGTLADTSPIHARAFREAFAPLGILPDYSTIAGITTEAAVDRLLGRAGLKVAAEERAALVRDKRNRALDLIGSNLAPIDGSIEFVRRAKPAFRLALCTSGSRAAVDRTILLLGLGGMFDPVITANDVQSGKPDPEGFLKILAETGERASDALVFEDADSGLKAAASAGIEAVRIGDGGGQPPSTNWATLTAALGEIGR